MNHTHDSRRHQENSKETKTQRGFRSRASIEEKRKQKRNRLYHGNRKIMITRNVTEVKMKKKKKNDKPKHSTTWHLKHKAKGIP